MRGAPDASPVLAADLGAPAQVAPAQVAPAAPALVAKGRTGSLTDFLLRR